MFAVSLHFGRPVQCLVIRDTTYVVIQICRCKIRSPRLKFERAANASSDKGGRERKEDMGLSVRIKNGLWRNCGRS